MKKESNQGSYTSGEIFEKNSVLLIDLEEQGK